MEDVARRARISRPNLYRYVSSREDLVRLVVLHRAKHLTGEFKPRQGAWDEILIDLFVQNVRNAIHDEIFMIIVEQAAPIASELLINDPGVGGALNNMLIPAVEGARQAGLLRDDLSDEQIIHWIHYQVWCLSRDPRMVSSVDVERLGRQFVIGGLLARPAAVSGRRRIVRKTGRPEPKE